MSTLADQHLGGFLAARAARHGDRPAVLDEHGTLTFAALDAVASAWADRLLTAGVGPGTHVGLLAGNSTQWLAVAFGVWRAGGTLVPISTFVTARELGDILEHADIEVLVLQSHFRQRDFEALLRATPAPRLRQVIVLDAAPPAAGGAPKPNLSTLDSQLSTDSTACILYTSGTTSVPKGVRLSHRAILATVGPTAERSGLTGDDTLLSTLPLFWVAGLVIRALPTLATGCALVLCEVFSPDAILALLRRHPVTALHLRPPQVGQLLAHPGFDAALLARVRRGNGRVEWYAPHLDAEHTRFITGYGMTEMAGYVTALDWRDSVEVRRTQLGRPLPGVELRIVDAQGADCQPGAVGEIWIRGPGMFAGYHKQPPDAGLSADGFFRSGDLGSVDVGGTFQFVGRSKDLLRIKGINVSPVEVEAVLATHPAVESVYIVGLPPDGLEQQLVALIVPRPPADQSIENELRALARTALSHYKRPEHYVFIGRHEVSLSGTSKPQRAALAALAAARC